jgi:tetratricopeptide (TPR) repeat protein
VIDMRNRVFALFILFAATLSTPPAHARATDDKAAAKAAFREGQRRYEVGDFENALSAFKRAYLAYEEPAFLFNIAQCERMLGQKREALREYRVYLHKVASSSNRGEVQKIISDLETALAAEESARERPPQGTAEPRADVAQAPAPSPAPSVAIVEPSPQPLLVAETSSPHADKPAYKKWWVWTLVGVGAVGVGLGVGLAVGLKPASNHTTLPGIGPRTSAVRQ